MTALFNVSHIRQLEDAFAASRPKVSLMQRAGDAVARLAEQWLKQHSSPAVLVLAGPGNNGGDAWVAAEALRKARFRVTVLTLGEPVWTNPAAKKAQA
jgi:NAD(P)H-hydrate repair Nnr-like enzyme with NAD(P)H-hydrate epimerase domain